MIEFNAKALILRRTGVGVWSFEDVVLTSIEDIVSTLGASSSEDVIQTNINKYEKLYTLRSITSAEGVIAKIKTDNEGTVFSMSPLLFVLCDDVKPIDITETFKEKITGIVDLY